VRHVLPLSAAALLLTAACDGDAGRVRRVEFAVSVVGATPNTLQTPSGWEVSLAAAELSVAAVYFRNARNAGGTADEQGRVVAQVLGPFTIDALDPEPQTVAVMASAVTERALSAEVWLTEAEQGPVADALGPFAALVHVAGVARRAETEVAFDGGLQFPEGREQSGYQTWSNRRIRRLACDLLPSAGGELQIRVDPGHFLDAVQFDSLSQADGAHTFITDAEQLQLRNGIALTGAYGFGFEP
jgi:hypothetical protein